MTCVEHIALIITLNMRLQYYVIHIHFLKEKLLLMEQKQPQEQKRLIEIIKKLYLKIAYNSPTF